MYQADRDNKDELAYHLEEMANILLAMERTVVSGVPKSAKLAMEKLKHTSSSMHQEAYHDDHVDNQDP